MRIAPHEFLQRPFDLYRFVPIISGVKRVMGPADTAADHRCRHDSQKNYEAHFHCPSPDQLRQFLPRDARVLIKIYSQNVVIPSPLRHAFLRVALASAGEESLILFRPAGGSRLLSNLAPARPP
jgi:hypothetical protein